MSMLIIHKQCYWRKDKLYYSGISIANEFDSYFFSNTAVQKFSLISESRLAKLSLPEKIYFFACIQICETEEELLLIDGGCLLFFYPETVHCMSIFWGKSFAIQGWGFEMFHLFLAFCRGWYVDRIWIWIREGQQNLLVSFSSFSCSLFERLSSSLMKVLCSRERGKSNQFQAVECHTLEYIWILTHVFSMWFLNFIAQAILTKVSVILLRHGLTIPKLFCFESADALSSNKTRW